MPLDFPVRTQNGLVSSTLRALLIDDVMGQINTFFITWKNEKPSLDFFLLCIRSVSPNSERTQNGLVSTTHVHSSNR